MKNARLTKSDYLSYLDCPESFWLERNKPGVIMSKPRSKFAQFLVNEGYAVEAEAKKLIASWPDAHRFSFQTVFETTAGLYARADMVRTRVDGSVDLFEIKGSTALKGSDGSDHVLDACYQTIVAEKSGAKVSSVSIIHVNMEYERSGDINPSELLVIVEVTERVAEMRDDVEATIAECQQLIASDAINEAGCHCRYKGNRNNHCSAFAYLNPNIVEPSAYLLPRISSAKLRKFDKEGRLALVDLKESDLTALQIPVWRALTSGEPVIDKLAVAEFLDALEWPLYFYDYETFAAAIPPADGHSPHQPLPVQFSVHRLDKNGEITHFEYLSDFPGDQDVLAKKLSEVIGSTGSLLVWNKSTEMSLNKRMARILPNFLIFLSELNDRTVDLMEVFKRDWVDPGFRGSTSIKNVLPVLVPELSYDHDAVHDGTGAMLAWWDMVSSADPDERVRLKSELLEYCKTDTLAMLEIVRVLRAIPDLCNYQ